MIAAIIIGGGPAGCQCALWLKMLGYEVIIVEKNNQLGGLQSSSPYLNNWMVGTMDKQGQEIAKNIQLHIELMKIPVFYNSTVEEITRIQDGFKVKIGNEDILAYHIVIATGVRANSGNFEPENNVIIGPGKKISQAFFNQKSVAILGGGDNAAENYSFIKEQKPKKCHVYARTVKARNSLWSQVDQSDKFVGEYKADQASMTILHQGHRRIYDSFVVLYGWEANIPNVVLPFSKELLDERNFVLTDEQRKTKIDNIYAAGEVTQRTHPCVSTAMADGVIVAKSIQSRLEKMKNKTTLRCKL